MSEYARALESGISQLRAHQMVSLVGIKLDHLDRVQKEAYRTARRLGIPVWVSWSFDQDRDDYMTLNVWHEGQEEPRDGLVMDVEVER